VFGAVYKSISLRILLDLTSRPQRMIKSSEISDQQIPSIFIERSSILLDNGLVVQDGDTYAPTPAGLKLATRVARLRSLFAIGDSGLYDFGSSSPNQNPG
jgi:predicted transcriptional regulator